VITMAAAQLQKPFTCYGCGQEIKLQRKDDNSGWFRFEADGHTPHRCERKKQQQPQQPSQSQVVQRPSQPQQQQHQQIQAQELPLGHQLATLTDVVVRLERRIDLLAEEVQAMRTELLVQQQHQYQQKKKKEEEKEEELVHQK
jgi:hypothetical protein